MGADPKLLSEADQERANVLPENNVSSPLGDCTLTSGNFESTSPTDEKA